MGEEEDFWLDASLNREPVEVLGHKDDVVVVRNLGEETGSRILDELHLVSEFGKWTVKGWNECMYVCMSFSSREKVWWAKTGTFFFDGEKCSLCYVSSVGQVCWHGAGYWGDGFCCDVLLEVLTVALQNKGHVCGSFYREEGYREWTGEDQALNPGGRLWRRWSYH